MVYIPQNSVIKYVLIGFLLFPVISFAAYKGQAGLTLGAGKEHISFSNQHYANVGIYYFSFHNYLDVGYDFIDIEKTGSIDHNIHIGFVIPSSRLRRLYFLHGIDVMLRDINSLSDLKTNKSSFIYFGIGQVLRLRKPMIALEFSFHILRSGVNLRMGF